MKPNTLTRQLKLKHPLIVAPMAGGPSSPELVIASSQAGALGSIGAAYSTPEQIENFVNTVRAQTKNPISINLFIPTGRVEVTETALNKALNTTEIFRKKLNIPQPVINPPYEENFDQQFEIVLKTKPEVLSFIFGKLKPEYIKALKKEKIFSIGTATTLDEALELEDSEIDAITLQGFEAGGHRGLFDPTADDSEISIYRLLEHCRPKIKIPLIAAGGIMNADNIKKSLSKGADAVQMGTAFLTCLEAGTNPAYRKVLLQSEHRDTKTTRAFSGRLARGIKNEFIKQIENNADSILPFPAQNKLTRDIRTAAAKNNISDYLSLWSGTGHGKLWTGSTADLIDQLFK